MCEPAKLLHALCVLVVIVLGCREMQCVFIYRREMGGRWVREGERENHEACKRWMCALITVMAIVAFHLLSLKHLVTPSSWWGRFLPRLITHMASRRYRACSEASSDTHVHTYACMYARTRTYSRTCTIAHTHACTYADTCTAPWQVAMTGHPAAMTRSGWIRTLLRCQERRAELS